MSYADGLLSTGERIAHREKQHWFVFVWGAKLAVAAVILGLILLILSQNLAPDQRASLGMIMGVASAVLVIGGLAVLGWHIMRYLNQEYVLTNRRVIQVAGVLNKTSMDSSLEKINDARLSQSVFGRIFGFGDLEQEAAQKRADALEHRRTLLKSGHPHAHLRARCESTGE